jgi:hypothetical protein
MRDVITRTLDGAEFTANKGCWTQPLPRIRPATDAMLCHRRHCGAAGQARS